MTKTKTFAAALMASALIAAPALAQSNPPVAKPTPSTMQPAPKTMAETPSTRTSQSTDQWRTSKLVGLNVYNAANEKVGDINELILGQDGKIDLIVVGAGGFLGMGEHNVALKWNQVKFVSEPVKAAATTTTTRPANTTGSGVTTTATTVRDYPDHAVVSMTKDQLKALPAFKYASDTSKR